MGNLMELSIEELIYLLSCLTSDEHKAYFDKDFLLQSLFLKIVSTQNFLLKSKGDSLETINKELEEITEMLTLADLQHDTHVSTVVGVLDLLAFREERLGDALVAQQYKRTREILFPLGRGINTRSYREEVGAVVRLEETLKQDTDARNVLGSLTFLNGQTALDWVYEIVEAGKKLAQGLEQRIEKEEKRKALLKVYREKELSLAQGRKRGRDILRLLDSTLSLLVRDGSVTKEHSDKIMAPIHQHLKKQTKKKSVETEAPS